MDLEEEIQRIDVDGLKEAINRQTKIIQEIKDILSDLYQEEDVNEELQIISEEEKNVS